MANIEIELDVECATCRSVLSTDFTGPLPHSRTASLQVTPCDRCLDKARDEGYDEGQREASGDA